MQAMFYEIDHRVFSFSVERSDRFFGVGLNGFIEDEHGEAWARCHFVTHAEFPGFDEMQSMETMELAHIALEILKSGGHQAISECRNAGLVVGFRLNSHDDGLRTDISSSRD